LTFRLFRKRRLDPEEVLTADEIAVARALGLDPLALAEAVIAYPSRAKDLLWLWFKCGRGLVYPSGRREQRMWLAAWGRLLLLGMLTGEKRYAAVGFDFMVKRVLDQPR
jgi:hypothetical protein